MYKKNRNTRERDQMTTPKSFDGQKERKYEGGGYFTSFDISGIIDINLPSQASTLSTIL